MGKDGPTRWGIMSAGKISQDFVKAMSFLDKKEHVIIAVGARSEDSAKDFAKKYNIPSFYGSYEELVGNPDIDVVYIGSINTTHLNLSKLALDHGKHVLCEKPLCMNVKQVKELISYAESKKLFLMEALWSRFLPSYQKLRNKIDSGAIGDPVQVTANFGVPIEGVDRVRKKDLGGGTVLDIGVYCINFADMVFKGEKPVKIVAAGQINANGVDESMSATLIYPNGGTATLTTNSRFLMENDAVVYGTKGKIKLADPFHCSTDFIQNGTDREVFTSPGGPDDFVFKNSGSLNFQCHEVRRCINEGLIESPVMSHKDSLRIAEIEQEIRQQIGVSYPQD